MVNKKGGNEISDIRRDYAQAELSESSVEDDPIRQFSIWFEQALKLDLLDPNAMTLSTVSADGRPSSRTVLLKGVEEYGFRFFSNYGSRKAQQLQENANAALCFFWPSLERQVRVEGKVQKISREESESYFSQRPRKSKLGAWASKQSSKVSSREALEDKFAEVKQRYEDQEVPCPDFWGGYLLKPSYLEFWQGRKGRLHDRICYQKGEDDWQQFRLAP